MSEARRPYLIGRLVVLGACLVGTGSLADAQDRKSQMIVIPNPTPREPDLDKRFASTTPPAKLDAARFAAFNQQRYRLLVQATSHLSTLATVLQNSLIKRQGGSPLTQEERMAGSIEELATNVYSSMAVTATHTAAASPDTGSQGHTMQQALLTADAQELVGLTQALQMEVGRSTADTLPAGVLIKSARVRDLAHVLKEQMQTGASTAR